MSSTRYYVDDVCSIWDVEFPPALYPGNDLEEYLAMLDENEFEFKELPLEEPPRTPARTSSDARSLSTIVSPQPVAAQEYTLQHHATFTPDCTHSTCLAHMDGGFAPADEELENIHPVFQTSMAHSGPRAASRYTHPLSPRREPINAEAGPGPSTTAHRARKRGFDAFSDDSEGPSAGPSRKRSFHLETYHDDSPDDEDHSDEEEVGVDEEAEAALKSRKVILYSRIQRFLVNPNGIIRCPFPGCRKAFWRTNIQALMNHIGHRHYTSSFKSNGNAGPCPLCPIKGLKKMSRECSSYSVQLRHIVADHLGLLWLCPCGEYGSRADNFYLRHKPHFR